MGLKFAANYSYALVSLRSPKTQTYTAVSVLEREWTVVN